MVWPCLICSRSWSAYRPAASSPCCAPARDDRHAAVHHLLGRRDYQALLLGQQRGGLAYRATHDQPRHAVADQGLDDAVGGRDVQAEIAPELRGDGGEHALLADARHADLLVCVAERLTPLRPGGEGEEPLKVSAGRRLSWHELRQILPMV